MKFHQFGVLLCVIYTLCLITIILFYIYGEEEYSHVPEEQILDALFSANVPNLIKKSNIDCRYHEILTSTNSLYNSEIPETAFNLPFTEIDNGSYVPKDCNPVFSVAILVTYRNREAQLRVFLPYMHNFLRKQNIHYRIYLIEQADEKPWNKGLLYNIGVKQAIADKFPCVILHDVDLLPLDERNLYVCTKFPRHMSACVDKFNYQLPFEYLVGGVLAIRSDQFVAVNGFSNRFRDWGSEDDDFATRLSENGVPVLRFPRSMSRYLMIRHKPQSKNPDRLHIYAENRRLSGDGFGALRYTSVTLEREQLFTKIQVVT